MSENVRLQSKEKKIEQQEVRHGKICKEDNTNGSELWEENIEDDEWEVDGRKEGHHVSVVEDEEEEPTREEEAMEDIEVESQWEADETVQEQHEPLLEGREERPIREESNDEH